MDMIETIRDLIRESGALLGRDRHDGLVGQAGRLLEDTEDWHLVMRIENRADNVRDLVRKLEYMIK